MMIDDELADRAKLKVRGVLSRPLGKTIPFESLVFSCSEAIEGTRNDFGEDAALYEQATSRVSTHTRAVFPLFPAFAYDRPDPRFIDGPNAEAIERIARIGEAIKSQCFPASILCESRDIRLNGDVIHYHEGDNLRVIYETCRFNDRHAAEGDRLYETKADECLNEQGIYLHLASVGSHNYGHWLTDDLPRLRAFFVLRQMYPKRTITIVMPSYNVTIDEVRLRSIRLFLGWNTDWHVIFLDRNKIYSFTQLYHVTPCSYQPLAKSPEAMTTARDRLLRNTRTLRLRQRFERAKAFPLDTIRGGGRRLFIDRQQFRGRAIVNRDDILKIVACSGFEVIDPETMDPSEQVVRFSNANFVMGIMGAAMTNTMFCPTRSRVIHLSPDAEWSDPFFWDLAAVCGHRYAAVYGRWAEIDQPERLRNFYIDPTKVEAALRHV